MRSRRRWGSAAVWGLLALTFVACAKTGESGRARGEVVALRLDPPTVGLGSGGDALVTVFAVRSSGLLEPVDSDCTWTLSDEGPVRLEPRGPLVRVVAKRAGITRLRVVAGALSAEASVAVADAQPLAFTIGPREVRVTPGTSVALSASVRFDDGRTTAPPGLTAWAVSDPAIAEVVPGASEGAARLTVFRSGSAVVSATWKGWTAQRNLQVDGPSLERLVVWPVEVLLARQTEAALSAVALFADGSALDVSGEARWTSAAAAVVTVDASGRARAMGGGGATLVVSWGGISQSIPVKVVDEPLAGVEVAPPALVLPTGAEGSLRATARFAIHPPVDVTGQALWRSTRADLARVDTVAPGVVNAEAPGEATVTAEFLGAVASAAVTVEPARLATLSVDPARLVLPKGSSAALSAAGVWTDGTRREVTQDATWSSSAPSVVEVSDAAATRGKLVARALGRATIASTLDGVTSFSTVEVSPAALVAVEVLPAAAGLARGLELPLRASATYSDGVVLDVTAFATWSSSSPAIAAVEPAGPRGGTVRALEPGEATVAAAWGGQGGTARITVGPAVLTALAIEPSAPVVAQGAMLALRAVGRFTDGAALDLTGAAAWTVADDSVARFGAAPGSLSGRSQGTTRVRAVVGSTVAEAAVVVTSPVVTALAVSPQALELGETETATLQCAAIYSDGSRVTVTPAAAWTSEAPDVAKVASTGFAPVVTAVREGRTRIHAQYAGRQGFADVVVVPPKVLSLRVVPSTLQLRVGQAATLRAEGFVADGSVRDVSARALWSATSPKVALDPAVGGRLTAREAGQVMVVAALDGANASCTVTIPEPVAIGLSLQPASLELEQGASGSLRAVLALEGGATRDVTDQASWSAAPAFACRVTQGVVTTRSTIDLISTCTVTASFQTFTASTAVRITRPAPPRLQALSIVPPDAVLRRNLVYPCRAYALYSDGRVQDVTQTVSWSSKEPAIATVVAGSTPAVWARRLGDTQLSVRLEGLVHETWLRVADSQLSQVVITPASLLMPIGVSAKLRGIFLYDDGWAVQVLDPTWRSPNPEIATVDGSGLVAAVSRGSTRVEVVASDGLGNERRADIGVRVRDQRLVSLQILGPDRTFTGIYSDLRAVGTAADGSVHDLGPSPSWTVSDPARGQLSADASGASLLALEPGRLVVRAWLAGLSAEKTVTVSPVNLAKLTLTVAQPSLPRGGTSPVQVQATFEDGTAVDVTRSVAFESTAPEVAVIQYGMWDNAGKPVLIAMSAGKAAVRTRLLGIAAEAAVSVSSATLRTLGLALGDGAVLSLLRLRGVGPARLRAVGTFSDGSTADVTAMCSFAPAALAAGVIATVSNADSGLLDVHSFGAQTLTATYAPAFIGQTRVDGMATLRVEPTTE